jgi:5S rRNA maturation endonuclease (ribonuclease M5)
MEAGQVILGQFDSTKASLLLVLRDVHEGRIQLPDFQRGWVWDDEHVRSLLASISLAFPIGAVMLLQTGNPKVRFKPRLIEGVRLASPTQPDQLILDGQQRLTSLYQAILMNEPVSTSDGKKNSILRWYYIDLAKALDMSGDREDALFGVPPDRMLRNFRGEVSRDLSTPEKECREEAFPVNLLYDIAGLNRWQMMYLQLDQDHLGERLQRWNQVIETVVQPFQQYQLPIIHLGRATSKEAVCKVFEKVNTGGVSLTVFELLTATYAAEDYSLRDDWLARSQRLRAARTLRGVESTDFLQAIALLSTLNRKRRDPGGAVGCKRKDILELELDEYRQWAESAMLGFERAARFLFEEKFFDARDLPYRTQVVPLAAVFADLGSRAENAGILDKVRRWYWCGVLGELYGAAVESRFAKDVPQVLEWIDDGPEPDTVTEAAFRPVRLRTLRTRLSAAYKGLHAVMMRDGARDFRSGRAIDSQLYFEERVDIHHVFPVAWCSKRDIPPDVPDCIVNRTPISAASNRAIGGAAPSQYLGRLQRGSGISEEDMNSILTSHMINPEALRTDDFWAFVRTREEALIERIERAMGKPVVGAAAVRPEAAIGPEGIPDGVPGAVPRVPEEASAVLVVEGQTDDEYLRVATEITGRPDLLQDVHVIVCEGVNGVVRQAVLIKNHERRPVVALFDKDEIGKAGRETLLKRFGFTKHQVMTYAEVFDGGPDSVEAEDLFPSTLLQRFVETLGEENVLSEKRMHPQLKTWHYGLNAAGKEMIAQFLREHASGDDVTRWIKLLELIRARCDLEVRPATAATQGRRSGGPQTARSSDRREVEEADETEDGAEGAVPGQAPGEGGGGMRSSLGPQGSELGPLAGRVTPEDPELWKRCDGSSQEAIHNVLERPKLFPDEHSTAVGASGECCTRHAVR